MSGFFFGIFLKLKMVGTRTPIGFFLDCRGSILGWTMFVNSGVFHASRENVMAKSQKGNETGCYWWKMIHQPPGVVSNKRHPPIIVYSIPCIAWTNFTYPQKNELRCNQGELLFWCDMSQQFMELLLQDCRKHVENYIPFGDGHSSQVSGKTSLVHILSISMCHVTFQSDIWCFYEF